MALTLSNVPNVWPYATSITLGTAGVVTVVTLPLTDVPLKVTLRPRTYDGKLVGANAALADGASLGSNGYRTMDHDQEFTFTLPPARPNDAAPNFALASGTSSAVVEIDVEPMPVTVVRT